MLKKYAFLGLALSVFVAANAQSGQAPTYETTGTFIGETIALRDAPSVEISEGIPENITIVPKRSV